MVLLGMENRGCTKGCNAPERRGLDSTTVLALAAKQGYELYALSFRYGQRHAFELEAASRIRRACGTVQHVVFDVNIGQFGGSALTSTIAVPKDRDVAGDTGIDHYVPARNTVFLSLALAWAETLGAQDVFIGVNALDYSGCPDCRHEFIEAFPGWQISLPRLE